MAKFHLTYNSSVLPVEDNGKARVDLLSELSNVALVIDTGRDTANAGTLASGLLRVVVTLNPDREAFREEQQANRLEGKKGTGLKADLPRFLGMSFEAMPKDVQNLCASRSAQAQYSQAKSAYEGREKKAPDLKASILAQISKLDAPTLADLLVSIAESYPEQVMIKAYKAS